MIRPSDKEGVFMKQPGNLCYKDILIDRLVAKLRQAGELRAYEASSLLRLEIDVDGLVLFDWLAAQKAAVKVHWANRRGDFEAAGIGAADVLTDDTCDAVSDVLAEIDRRVAAADGAVRYYGGIAFDPEHDQSDLPREGKACLAPTLYGGGIAPDRRSWAGFGRFRFFVPRIELRRERGDTTLAVNIRRTPDDTVEALEQEVLHTIDEVVFDVEPVPDGSTPEPPRILRRTDLPDRTTWCDMVSDTMHDVAAGALDKLVHFRQAVLAMSAPVDPAILLNHIARHSAGAYSFCFQLGPHDAFLGASPECLYSRRGADIYSEAIAGTVLSGSTDAERRYHRGLLSDSAKDCEEHAYVFDGVQRGLERLCRKVRVIDRRDIVSLGYVQHFCSRFAGRLRDDVATADIVAALHPTAAVNGHPRQAALEHIRAREPFTRGWYAGPVGWIGADGSEFAVAIRSARVLDDQISLFAGAGIVRGSDPDSEWDETENKLSLFLNAIGRRP
jgi:menaquinone-specific isochorismate synthase